MSEIYVVEDPLKVIKDFLEDKEIDIKEILDREDLFRISLSYKKYNSAVAAPVARFIIYQQNFIYKIAALLKYKSPRISKLSKEEKQRLEIAFRVEPGSTSVVVDLLRALKEFIAMFPESVRVAALFFSMVGGAYWMWSRVAHLKNVENTKRARIEADLAMENLKSESTIKEKKMLFDLIEKVVDKVPESKRELRSIIDSNNRETLNALEAIDDEVIYQGNVYTKGDLRELKKLWTQESAASAYVKPVNGEYRIVSINVERKFISIKADNDIIKVYYSRKMIETIRELPDQIRNAIDDPDVIFHIEANHSTDTGRYELSALSRVH